MSAVADAGAQQHAFQNRGWGPHGGVIVGDRVTWDKGQPFSVLTLSQQQPTHFSLLKHFLLDFSCGHSAFWAVHDLPLPHGHPDRLCKNLHVYTVLTETVKCGQSDLPSRNFGTQSWGLALLHAPGSSLSSPGSTGPPQPVSPLSFCGRARLGFCGFYPKLRCHQRPDLLPSTNKHLTNLGPSAPQSHAPVIHSGHFRPCS